MCTDTVCPSRYVRLKCFLTRRVIRPQTSRAFSTRRFSTGIRRAMLEDRKRQHLYRHAEESLRICLTCAFTEMAQTEQTHFFTEIPPSAVDCNVSLVYLWRTERLHETLRVINLYFSDYMIHFCNQMNIYSTQNNKANQNRQRNLP